MSGGNWNPWKFTAIGLALVVATAVVTGIVVANWTGTSTEQKVSEPNATVPTTHPKPAQRPAAPRTTVAATPPASSHTPAAVTAPAAPAPARPAVPSEAAIEACNRAAAAAPTTKDKTIEVVKDSAVAGIIGAAVGAAGGAIADGGKGAGKGAAIGGVVGVGAGALYGLNENRKNDERYREAYAACMRSRGFAG